MKMFSKTNYDMFPKLGYIANIYINRIFESYNVNSDLGNLINIKKFFDSFSSLSKEEFLQKSEGIKRRKQDFILLYGLAHGDKCTVEVILHNNSKTVNSENMDSYVQYMKNAATSNLKKAIEKLEKMIEEQYKTERKDPPVL